LRDRPSPGRAAPVILLAVIAGAGSFTTSATPPSTRTSTASRSPGTRCAPGSASPTRPPPACCAGSAPARKDTSQKPHAPRNPLTRLHASRITGVGRC